MRLRAGDRPSEARLLPGEFLPLPPCDTDRAAYVQLEAYAEGNDAPPFQQRCARTLVGDDQPAALDAAAPAVEAGCAALLGEDLHRADAREAGRAILGMTLLLDWHRGPSQLGPELHVGANLRDLATRAAELSIDDARHAAGAIGAWRFHPAEALAFASQQMPLRAGDVVGFGAMSLATPQFGQRVAFSVERFMTLRGWAVRGPEPVGWRLA